MAIRSLTEEEAEKSISVEFQCDNFSNFVIKCVIMENRQPSLNDVIVPGALYYQTF